MHTSKEHKITNAKFKMKTEKKRFKKKHFFLRAK